MKILTTTVIKTLKGEPFKDGTDDLTVGVAIANILSFDEAGGRHKTYVLSKKFMDAGDVVEVDSADLAIIKKACETTKFYQTSAVTGFIIEVLENVKDPSEKK
jgi:hypothetical protein